MKVVATGDWHIRNNKPVNYIGDFQKDQFSAVEWILTTAKRVKADIVVQPGDFFDSPNTPFFLISKYIELFRYHKIWLWAIFGQHDLRYHTAKHNTPLNLLAVSGQVMLLDPEPFPHDMYFYGSNWGEEIPYSEKGPAALVTHRMIIHKEKLWLGQTDYDEAETLLDHHPFQLIVSGDNHKGFVVQKDGKTLINCGSLMRTNISQEDHHPFIVVYDTISRESDIITMPNAPFSEIMDLKKSEKQKEKDERMQAFVSGLTTEKPAGLDFVGNLDAFIKANGITEDVTKVIHDSMKEGKQ